MRSSTHNAMRNANYGFRTVYFVLQIQYTTVNWTFYFSFQTVDSIVHAGHDMEKEAK